MSRLELPPGTVGIDCRSLVQGPAGIATCVRNLLEHIGGLERLDSVSPANNFLWNQIRAGWAQVRRGWKIYHAPTYTGPLVNRAKLVLMVADVSYLLGGDIYPYPTDPFRNRYYRASLRRASRIIVPTDFTRSELVRLFPDLAPRIRRIYLGVSEAFRRDERLGDRVRREFNLPDRFVLHVGDIHPRRNLGMLREAAEHLSLPLVLVGKILRGGEEFGDYEKRLEGVSLDQLVGLYSAATVFGYPSSYEGFGLPLVEAMACGLPVVASNLSCLPEVCGDATVLRAPSVEGFAEGLEEALGRPEELRRRGLARAKLFSWKRTAEKTFAIYRELLK